MPASATSAIDQAFKLPIDRLEAFVVSIETSEVASDREAAGIARFRCRDHVGASQAFAGVSPDHAFDPRTQQLRMRLALAGGVSSGALRLARTILDADPANIETLRMAGRICNNAREFDRADRFWRQLADISPKDKEAALQVARIAARRGMWEAVELYAALAHEAQPKAAEPVRLLLDAAVNAGKTDAIASTTAAEDAKSAIYQRRLADAAASAATASELNPENLDIREVAIQASAMSGSTDAASAWRDLQAVDPRRATSLLDRMVRAQTISFELLEPLLTAGAEAGSLTSGGQRAFEHRRGLALADALAAEVAGRPIEAAAAWRRMMEISPGDSEVVSGIARTLKGLHDALASAAPDEQREAAALLVDLAPGTGAGQRYIIEQAVGREHRSEAPRLVDDLSAGPAQVVDAAPDLIVVRAQPGDGDGAIATRQSEVSDDVPHAIIDVNRTSLDDAVAAEDWAIAIRCVARATALDDPAVETMRSAVAMPLKTALGALEADDPARIMMLRHLYAIVPADTGTTLKFGRLLMRERLYEEAIPVWRGLSEATPSALEPWLQWGRSARKLGRGAEALAALEEVLALDPSHEEAGRYYETLRARAPQA